MDYSLFGHTVTIDEDVIQYGKYYLGCENAVKQMLDRFTRRLESSKREITSSNYANILGMMASDFMGIFSCMYDAMWEYVKGTGIKNPGREALRDAVEALWMKEVKKLYDRQIYPVPHLVFQGFSGEGDSDAILKEAYNWVRGMDTGTVKEVPKEVSRIALAFPGVAAAKINDVVKGSIKRCQYDLLAYHGAVRRYKSVGLNDDNVSNYVTELATNGTFDYEGYVFLLKSVGDQMGEIRAIVEALGNLEEYEEVQRSLITDYVNSLNLNKEYVGYSIPQLMEYQRRIKEKADDLGYIGPIKQYNDIEKRIQDVRENEMNLLGNKPKQEREEQAESENEVEKAFKKLDRKVKEGGGEAPEEPKAEPVKAKLVELDEDEIQLELNKIKQGIKGQDIVGRYLFLVGARDHEWKSDEAKRAIRKLDTAIEKERESLRQKVKDTAMYKYIKYAVGGVGCAFTLASFMISPLFGIVALTMSFGGYVVIDVLAKDGVIAQTTLKRLAETEERVKANQENS